MKPIVSFIVPFYGNIDQKFLQRCVHSLRTQGMEEGTYEIVIADNGERGLGGARNDGLRKATGQYFLFVDADDYLLPGTLLPCVALLREHTPDILSAGYRKIRDELSASSQSSLENLQTTSPLSPLQEEAETFPSASAGVSGCPSIAYRRYTYGAQYMLAHNFCGMACRHFFRREFLRETGIEFPEARYHEDETFVARCYCLAGITLITEYPIYAYCLRRDSITSSSSFALRMARINDFRLILTDLRLFTENLSAMSVAATEVSLLALRIAAMRRRISFLTIDYLVQLYKNGCRWTEVCLRMSELKRAGFLPLPSRRYTWKYTLVRHLLSVALFLIRK